MKVSISQLSKRFVRKVILLVMWSKWNPGFLMTGLFSVITPMGIRIRHQITEES